MKNEELTKQSFEGWPVADEYLREVGRIALLWAVLENFLSICIGKLAGFNQTLDERAYILVAHSSFTQRLDIFGALCELLKSQFPALEKYQNVITLFKAAQKARNRFMHNSMSFDPESGEMRMAIGSARGKLKMDVASVSVADIKRVCVKIDEANRALYKLVLGRNLPPSWEQCPIKRP